MNRIGNEPAESSDDEDIHLPNVLDNGDENKQSDHSSTRTTPLPPSTNIAPSQSLEPSSSSATEGLQTSSLNSQHTPIASLSFKLKSSSKRKAQEPKLARWVWRDNHVESLLGILKEFKTFCDYKGIDFEGDGPQLNVTIRSAMAKLYPVEEFGPEIVDDRDQVQKSLASRGKTRVRDKILKIRSIYRNSVKENRRSGGGKVITENWDTLVFLWEGSPPVTSLPFGHRSAELYEDDQNDENEGDDENSVDNIEEQTEGDNEITPRIPPTKKTKVSEYIDNKRKNLEKNLSANQRDQIYLNIARDDLKMKEKMVENMVEGSKNIANSIDKMASAMGDIGKGIEKGLGLIALAMGGINQGGPQRRDNYANFSFNESLFSPEHGGSSMSQNFNQSFQDSTEGQRNSYTRQLSSQSPSSFRYHPRLDTILV